MKPSEDSIKSPRIIVDSRERNAELIGALKANGFTVDTRTLAVGDYIISDRLCVERKTVSDFESSIMNGRLFEQLERMKEAYALPIVLLEGDRDQFRLKQSVINGTVVSIYVDYGIPIIVSGSPTHTAEIILSMAKREQSGEKREPSLKGAGRAHSDSQFQEFVIGNLPGIGPKLAKSLLKHFSSIKSIANADIEELMKVEKIGEKKAEAIHKTFNGEYSP